MRLRRGAYGAIVLGLLVVGCGNSSGVDEVMDPEPGGMGGDLGMGGSGGDGGTGGTGGDVSSGAHTTVRALSFGYVGAEGLAPATIVYRIQVDPWGDTTITGDGKVNGFYYQVTASGGLFGGDTGTRVPFNGFRVDADGSLQLAGFEFTVVVNATETTLSSTTLEVKACSGGTTCDNVLWTDTYEGSGTPALPAPALTPAEWVNNGEIDFSLGTTELSVPASGVAAKVVSVELDDSVSQEATDWFFEHLVFFTADTGFVGRPFPNDVLQDQVGNESFVSLGVLPLELGAQCGSGENASCYVRYAAQSDYGQAITKPSDATRRDYLVYTRSTQSSVTVGVAAFGNVTKPQGCPGSNGQGEAVCPCLWGPDGESCGPTMTSDQAVIDVPTLTVTPDSENKQVSPTVTTTYTTSTEVGVDAPAGILPVRQVSFETNVQNALCGHVANPLSVQGVGPNYVISATDTFPDDSSLSFDDGLYLMVPLGLGACLSSDFPFCERTADRVSYIPHYTGAPRLAEGTPEKCVQSVDEGLNGGGVSAFAIGCATWGDQYTILEGQSTTTTAAQTYFDNCGYGYQYLDISGADRLEIPAAPTNFENYKYILKNDHSFPVVWAKECCSALFETSGNTIGATDLPSDYIGAPDKHPRHMQDSFGTWVPSGDQLTLTTVYPDQSMGVYHGLTGELLYKVRFLLTDYPNVPGEVANVEEPTLFGCKNTALAKATLTLGGSGTTELTLGTASQTGALTCNDPVNCPFGMSLTTEPNEAPRKCQSSFSTPILGVEEWASQFAPTEAIRISAWGGEGNSPGHECTQVDFGGKVSSGTGGARGFAGTVLQATDFREYPGYVALIGKDGASESCGGSATSLTGLVDVTAFAEAGATSAPEPIIVLAPGGGGGGRCSDGVQNQETTEDAVAGGNGGRGGFFAWNGASSQSFEPTAGVEKGVGNNGRAAGANGAGAPSANVQGEGGVEASSGGSGPGGGSEGCETFVSGSVVTSTDASQYPGHGGSNSTGPNSSRGGAGGAGWGGGGGAKLGGNLGAFAPSGGGGGGAWAKTATTTDQSWALPTTPPANPGGSIGVVELEINSAGAELCAPVFEDIRCVRCVVPTGTTAFTADEFEDREIFYIEAAGSPGGGGGVLQPRGEGGYAVTAMTSATKTFNVQYQGSAIVSPAPINASSTTGELYVVAAQGGSGGEDTGGAAGGVAVATAGGPDVVADGATAGSFSNNLCTGGGGAQATAMMGGARGTASGTDPTDGQPGGTGILARGGAGGGRGGAGYFGGGGGGAYNQTFDDENGSCGGGGGGSFARGAIPQSQVAMPNIVGPPSEMSEVFAGQNAVITACDAGDSVRNGAIDRELPQTEEVLLQAGDSFALIWESTGELATYNLQTNPRTKLWSSGTAGTGDKIVFQTDGNLVLRDANRCALFASNTADGETNNVGGRVLILWEATGELAIYDVNSKLLWQVTTGTFSPANCP